LNAAGSNVSSTLAASWAGWAVTSLAAKFYRSKPSTEQKANSPQSTATSNKDSPGTIDKSDKSDDRPLTPSTPNIQKSESGESMPDFDEEIWGSIDTSNNQSNTNKKSLDGWDNEEWNDFDETQTNDESERRGSSVKDEGEEFFDKFSATNKTYQTLKNAKGDWDNEESESWSKWDDGKESDVKLRTNTNTSAVSNEDSKKKAEERRQQRLKDLEERKSRKTVKGPMKLGAQRIA